MSIWWLLWFVLSFILLGATVWSLAILFRQKNAWQEFAKRKGVAFTKGTFSGPCSLDGIIDGVSISMFTATQQKEDSRKNRQLTVLQLVYTKPYIDAMAAGTSEMLPFLSSLNLLSVHALDNAKWDGKNNHLFSRNKKAVETYLTEERVLILNKILKVPSSDNLIILEPEQATFRFETSNPLTELAKIDSLVSNLIAAMKKLQPSDEEYKKLKKLYADQVEEKTS